MLFPETLPFLLENTVRKVPVDQNLPIDVSARFCYSIGKPNPINPHSEKEVSQ